MGRTAQTLWNGHRPENKEEDQPEQEDARSLDEMAISLNSPMPPHH